MYMIRIFLYSSICKSFEKENDLQLVHLLDALPILFIHRL